MNNLNGRKISAVIRKAGYNKSETSSGMIFRNVCREGYELTNIGSWYTLSYSKFNRNADTTPEVKKMMDALVEAGYECRYGSDLKDWIYIESYNE